jgi:hypothetical protein
MPMQAELNVECDDSEILRAVERAIRERTWGRVSNLCVELRGELVVVCGSTQTYYLKQLALEAAREALATTRPFLIDIGVT